MIPINTTFTVTQRNLFDIKNNVAEHIRTCYVYTTTQGDLPRTAVREALGFLLSAYGCIPSHSHQAAAVFFSIVIFFTAET
jgi:hypothetical protein